MNDNDYREWKVSLFGPKDTSYKGGVFFLLIKIPENYPKKAPEAYFLTPIYHLNVNPKASKFAGDGVKSLGHVCISTSNWWKPEYRMREVLTNIFALFYNPDPDNPYGLDRSDEFRQNRTIYEEKIKYFTKKYAYPTLSNKVYPRDEDWDFYYEINKNNEAKRYFSKIQK